MRKYLLLILFLIISNSAFSDYNPREDKQKQLFYFKIFIIDYENNIATNNKIISQINFRLKEINDKINILSQIIDNTSNTGQYDIANHEIEFLKKKEKIDRLKDEYKKRILWLYKNGVEYQYQLLFTSNSPLTFYRRLQYLSRLSQNRKNDIEKIKFEEFNISEHKKLRTLNNYQLKIYLSQKNEDKNNLLNEKLDLIDSLSLLKNINSTYYKQIEHTKNLIIETESILKSFSTNFVYKVSNQINYQNKKFNEAIGNFIHPVNSIDILQDFGRTVNSQTGTISYNNGIDVSIADNSEVKCIASGYVEDIIDLPYYHNTVIIRHDNNYRTIYSIMKKITVGKNSIVNAGDIIGYTSRISDSQMFHFEIRNGVSSIDPKVCLRRGRADY